METKEIIQNAHELARPFRITKGKDFRLKDVDPNDTLDFTKEADKPRAKEVLTMGVTALAELQDKLYAQDKWAVLLIFQAMDAAGKDGAIKHVMSGINPQGCEVYSFKSPSAEDLDHDFLWRCMKDLPNRGQIGIFNRGYYEEVLVVRVHPEFLAKQKLGPLSTVSVQPAQISNNTVTNVFRQKSAGCLPLVHFKRFFNAAQPGDHEKEAPRNLSRRRGRNSPDSGPSQDTCRRTRCRRYVWQRSHRTMGKDRRTARIKCHRHLQG